MTLTAIEKAAKLMGRSYDTEKQSTYVYDHDLADYIYTRFNPYTNKADLVDVELATIKYGMLRVMHFCACVVVQFEEYADTSKPYSPEVFENRQFYLHHDTYFTARAHAVMDVVSQIYDRRDASNGN